MEKLILGKALKQWKKEFPAISDIVGLKETIWINPNKQAAKEAFANSEITMDNVLDASKRLARFAPYIAKAFPETRKAGGIIESPLREIGRMKAYLQGLTKTEIPGRMLLKCDSELPISGSIKARGGIYEVLKHAEDIALECKLLCESDNYSVLDTQKFRDLFAKYSVAVGSTGNLGLSIGIMSARLGFHAAVHMSADARQWKKDMLRAKGVNVLEYDSDYSVAVQEGRRLAEGDKSCYFVDDENSVNLFMGYAVAALRLQNQLDKAGVVVDENHPLFVYLPCGVGGGPGGVAFGIKLIYGDNAHCFFAEPTHSPCMMLGLLTGEHDNICVQDFGIDNKTAADGLAVGRASSFVGKTIEPHLSGCYSITDEHMYQLLRQMTDIEHIKLEPSALAGVAGAQWICNSDAGKNYILQNNLQNKMQNATHLPWATGGNMVPWEIMEEYYKRGL